jgi:hypothetical protein
MALTNRCLSGLGAAFIEMPRARLGFRAGGVFSPRASAAEYKPSLGEVQAVTESASSIEQRQEKQKLLLVTSLASLAVGAAITYAVMKKS